MSKVRHKKDDIGSKFFAWFIGLVLLMAGGAWLEANLFNGNASWLLWVFLILYVVGTLTAIVQSAVGPVGTTSGMPKKTREEVTALAVGYGIGVGIFASLVSLPPILLQTIGGFVLLAWWQWFVGFYAILAVIVLPHFIHSLYGRDGGGKSSRYISAATKRVVFERDSGVCRRCRSGEYIEYDHILPVSQGGNSSAQNIQLLCRSCNRSKGAGGTFGPW